MIVTIALSNVENIRELITFNKFIRHTCRFYDLYTSKKILKSMKVIKVCDSSV